MRSKRVFCPSDDRVTGTEGTESRRVSSRGRGMVWVLTSLRGDWLNDLVGESTSGISSFSTSFSTCFVIPLLPSRLFSIFVDDGCINWLKYALKVAGTLMTSLAAGPSR